MSNWTNVTFTPNAKNPNVGDMSATWTDPTTGFVFDYTETINATAAEQSQFAVDAMAAAAKFQANEPQPAVTPAEVVAAVTPLLTS